MRVLTASVRRERERRMGAAGVWGVHILVYFVRYVDFYGGRAIPHDHHIFPSYKLYKILRERKKNTED